MRTKNVLIAIILLATLVRVALALALGDKAEPVSGAYDQVSYDLLAQRLNSGYGFTFPTISYPAIPANTPTSFWSFGYTLYLAGVYALLGHHPLAARLIQVLLSILHIWLIYRLSRRLFGEWVGIAAAALTAAYAYFIFFNAALMTQTFYILALLFALDLALDLANGANYELRITNHELRHWFLLGFFLGIAALLRQTILLFAPLLFAYIWWARRQGGTETRRQSDKALTLSPSPTLLVSLSPYLVSLLVIAALIFPWTLRNYLVYNDFLLLNSNGGFWLYSSNHPNQGTAFDSTYVAPIPEHLRGLSEPALDRALMREGIGFVIADPLRFALLTWSRIGAYFWIAPTEGSLPIANLARLLSFGLYFPLMLVGLWLSRTHWRLCLPLYLYVAFETTFCLLSWAAPRYRLPSDAIMMVFAGLAAITLTGRFGITQRFTAESSIINLKS